MIDMWNEQNYRWQSHAISICIGPEAVERLERFGIAQVSDERRADLTVEFDKAAHPLRERQDTAALECLIEHRLGATHAVSICIGPSTISRLARGEAVEVNGVTLYTADGGVWPGSIAAGVGSWTPAAPNRTTQINAVHALLHANRNHAPTREFAAEVVEAVLRAGSA